MIPNRMLANIQRWNRPAYPVNAAFLATFASDTSRVVLVMPILARRRKRDRDEAEEEARWKAQWLDDEEGESE